MRSLSLLNNFDREFARPFLSPLWFKNFEDFESEKVGMSSQIKFNNDTSSWELTLEAPGVAKNNLKVDVKEGLLTLTGEKTKGLELGKFEKHFKLPNGVDVENVEALFEDGVLTVTLPLESKKATKTIQIK